MPVVVIVKHKWRHCFSDSSLWTTFVDKRAFLPTRKARTEYASWHPKYKPVHHDPCFATAWEVQERQCPLESIVCGKLERDIIHRDDGGPLTGDFVQKIIRQSMYHFRSERRRLELQLSSPWCQGGTRVERRIRARSRLTLCRILR